MIGGACSYNGISTNAVAIGALAGNTNPPGEGTVSIGFNAGSGTSASVKGKSVQIGDSANIAGSGMQATAVGYQSNSQGDYSVALGGGAVSNGLESTAAGYQCHSQGDYSVALGVNAVSNGISAITIGAGARAEGLGSIGIGGRYNGGSPYGTLGIKAVVIGDGTALNGAVEENAVVIGASAGLSGCGEDNVIIGAFANSSNSTDQAICINATGANLAAVPDGLVIKPIVVGTVSGTTAPIKTASDTGFGHLLYYNITSGEIRAVPFA